MTLATGTLLTPADVSKRLRVPLSTLANWRYRNQGPEYTKVGRNVRYPEDALDRFLKNNTVKPSRVITV